MSGGARERYERHRSPARGRTAPVFLGGLTLRKDMPDPMCYVDSNNNFICLDCYIEKYTFSPMLKPGAAKYQGCVSCGRDVYRVAKKYSGRI